MTGGDAAQPVAELAAGQVWPGEVIAVGLRGRLAFDGG